MGGFQRPTIRPPCPSHLLPDSNAVSSERMFTYFTILMLWNSMWNSIRFGVPTTYNQASVPESLTARQQCCLLRTHVYLLYNFDVLEQYVDFHPIWGSNDLQSGPRARVTYCQTAMLSPQNACLPTLQF